MGQRPARPRPGQPFALAVEGPVDEFDIYIAGFEEQAGDAPEEQLARVFGLGMVEALEFVESLPRVVKRRVPGPHVERYERALREVRARYELRRSPIRPNPIIAVAGRGDGRAEQRAGRSGRTLTLPPPCVGESASAGAVDCEPAASSPAQTVAAFALTERPPARPAFATELESVPAASPDPAKTLVDSRPPLMLDTMDGWEDAVADPVPREHTRGAGRPGAATISDGAFDDSRGSPPAYSVPPERSAPPPPARVLGFVSPRANAPPAQRSPARPAPPVAWAAIEPSADRPEEDEAASGISVPPPSAEFDGAFPAASEVPGLQLQPADWLVPQRGLDLSDQAPPTQPLPHRQPVPRVRPAAQPAAAARNGRVGAVQSAPPPAHMSRAATGPAVPAVAEEPPLGMRIMMRVAMGLALFLLITSLRQSGLFGDDVSDHLQQWGGGFAERLEGESAVATRRRDPIALDWMESETHQFGHPDKDSVRAMIRRYLDAGAVQVYATEIRRELMMARAGALIVELPVDAERRAGVFEMQTSYFGAGAMRPGIPDRLKDVGQDVVTVRF